MNEVDRQAGLLRQTITEAWYWLVGNSPQIVIGVTAGALLVALMLGIRSFGIWLGRKEDCSLLRLVVSRVLRKTYLWFMIALAAELVVYLTVPPPEVFKAASFLFTIASALQGAIWIRELVLSWVEQRAQANGSDQGSLVSALGIIRLLVSIAAFALAAILILDNLGVNVTALVAGLGIGGIAIGLAAQGIFSDLFAALSILFDKPFKKGDTIRWDTTIGSVEAIGLKTTRVRAVTGERVIISNANLLGKELRNLEHLERRRVTFQIGLIYQTSDKVLEGVPEMLRSVVEDHKKCSFIAASFVGFGESSLDFELIFDVVSRNVADLHELRTRVGIAILRLFDSKDIQIAYPTQTTFTAAPDGTMIMPYPAEGLLPPGTSGQS